MLLPLQKVIFRLNYYSQGKASKMAWNSMHYDSVNVHFGRCGNQISAGKIEALWRTITKNTCTLATKI